MKRNTKIIHYLTAKDAKDLYLHVFLPLFETLNQFWTCLDHHNKNF